MDRIEFNVNDEYLVKLIIATYNRSTIVECVDITEELVSKTISRIKHDIKMYSSVPNEYKERIKFEMSNLFILESYVILNYGIDKLEVK